MHSSDGNAPTQLIDLLDHEYDSPDQAHASVPAVPAEPTEAGGPRSRTTVALALVAVVLAGVLAAALVLPLGVGRATTAVASPTLSAPETTNGVVTSTSSSTAAPTSSLEPSTTVTRPAPSTVVIVNPPVTPPRPTTTEAPTTSSSTTSSSTSTSTTAPKPPPQILTFTALETVPCLGKLGNGHAQLTFATKYAASAELIADGGAPKGLPTTSGAVPVTHACNVATHNYTLVVHGAGGDAKQTLTIAS